MGLAILCIFVSFDSFWPILYEGVAKSKFLVTDIGRGLNYPCVVLKHRAHMVLVRSMYMDHGVLGWMDFSGREKHILECKVPDLKARRNT